MRSTLNAKYKLTNMKSRIYTKGGELSICLAGKMANGGDVFVQWEPEMAFRLLFLLFHVEKDSEAQWRSSIID